MMKIVNGKFEFSCEYGYIYHLLEIIAPNDYEILHFNETEGIKNSSDEKIGYIENPRINMELKVGEYIYKLRFIRDFEKQWGTYWYLYLNPNPKYRTKIKLFRWEIDVFKEYIKRCIQRNQFDKLKFKA